MLRKMFFSLAVMGLAASVNAATTITVESAPTLELPGYTTYTLIAESDTGSIAGFDFSGGDNGFFGPMNQINPAGNATIFTDANGFFDFVGAKVPQDSQFMFASGDGTVVGAQEGADVLRAAMSFGTANARTGPLPFVQLAIPDGAAATVEYLGNFTVLSTGGPVLESVVGMVPPPGGDLPGIELMVGGMAIAPDGSVDFGLALQGAVLQRTFSIENTGAADLVLDSSSVSGDFSLVGAFPTTIGAGAMADFVIAGDTSNLGALSGLLEFGHNVDGVAAFSVDLSGQVVPEPSTFALAGLAMVGLVGFARRRK